VKTTESVFNPEQIVWANMVFVIVGVGFTVKVSIAITEAPQSFVTMSDTL